ncbi:sulfotransferase 1E1-like [Rhopilema esculentum]|uniref:sulfotransferase 1E1-like n=1 Tax=Rhopilema esculentum TaxID=499914 RepID=UPI0031DF3C8A|eukprot:gene6308-11735_t
MAAVGTAPLSEEDTERIKQGYPSTVLNLGHKLIRTIPGNYVLPAAYEKVKDRIKCWDVRKDDIYVFAFPKNGTTWTQELVWCVQNDCDIGKAKSVDLMERVPFLEAPVLLHFLDDDAICAIENMASPRILKSHLAFCLFPDDLLDKSKVVLCLRNPKDTVVSFYHHQQLMKHLNFVGEFKTFFNLFMDDLCNFCPYFDYVAEAWQRRNHPNMCILFYEEMKADLAGNVRRVARFLQKEMTVGQVQILVDHLSFKKMKENKAVNMESLREKNLLTTKGDFIRKGEVGDWKNYFDDEMNKRMNEAIEKYLKPIGLEFRYE